MRIQSTSVLLVVASACSTRGPSKPSLATEPLAIPLIAATAMATTAPTSRDDLTPPWTLTASDGSGLRLTRVEAKAVVEGPLAFTELHLYFRNTEARVREGTFQITLPGGAAVSRFAMESDSGRWMEAEVVPKLIARRAYDDFLHRKQDPALLEKAAGNQFTAKVFPIAANADKHLVISYSQELPGTRYTLPLRGLPKAERIDVELASTGSDGVRRTQLLAERDWQPDRDFVATAPATAAAVGSGMAVAAQIEIGGGAGRDLPASLTLLVDTSASRALGFTRYIASVRTLIGQLSNRYGTLPITVVAFDQDAQRVFDGPAAEFGDAHVRALLERGAAGASDIGQAIAWIGTNRAAKQRVLVIGDGVITAGLEGRALRDAVRGLGVERVDVALVGGLRDDRVAELLVTTGNARPGAVLDLETTPVADALGQTVLRDVAIDVPGATWVYPRVIPSARAGSKVMVFAWRRTAGATFDVIAGGARQSIQVLPGTAPLVARALAGAELAELETKLGVMKGDELATLRETIATKSVAARVLSTETSMLVLESDADFAQYGIDRKTLADILVIGPRGVEWGHRTRMPAGASSKPQVTATREPTRAPAATTPKPARGDDSPDRDADGILDTEDTCPSEPENYNGSVDDDGCPDRGQVIVTNTAIEILEPVYFQPDRAVIQTRSYPVLDAVAETMVRNLDIRLIEIQGHTDAGGNDRYNAALSSRRAQAVKQYLVAKGVETGRLTTQGYGATQPIDRSNTAAAWAKNRRVDFLILRRGDDNDRPATSPTPSAPATSAAPPPPPPPPPPAPITGELATIQKAIATRDLDGALTRARTWHAREPGNVLALIGLGEVLEAKGATATAARVYGSIIDLFPGRADMRRFAGERLSRLANANELAIDTLRRAVADRPDHMTGHRLLAYAYVRDGKPADAFAAIVAGLAHEYRNTSYAGGRQVLGDDAAMIGAVYAAAKPAKRQEIKTALAKHKLQIATTASTRFVLHWETDANDVDLHVEDARGGHAFYSAPTLNSGGELYDDVTTGYGPECFAIRGKPTAGPYKLSAHYYAQGPMGYGMGVLDVVRFDGKRLAVEPRPFVVMTNNATVDLGTVR